MSNGLITCKCGHEVADVPEPHPNHWLGGCPACGRSAAFEWVPNAPLERELEDLMSKPSQGALRAVIKVEQIAPTLRMEFASGKITLDEIWERKAAIIDEETGVAELLAIAKEQERMIHDCGRYFLKISHNHPQPEEMANINVRALTAIAKAEVKP